MPQDDSPHILVVEDEAIVRLVIVEGLRDLGFQVEACGTIAAVKEQVASRRGIDGMILDVGLPDGHGDQFAVELRSLLPALPIVLCTGYDDSTLQDFDNDSLVALCPKPCDVTKIASLLASLGVQQPVIKIQAA